MLGNCKQSDLILRRSSRGLWNPLSRSYSLVVYGFGEGLAETKVQMRLKNRTKKTIKEPGVSGAFQTLCWRVSAAPWASVQFSSVQSLSRVLLFATPWTAEHQASLSITNSRSLLKLMFIEFVMPSNRLILCHPLLPLPSIFPCIRVFSNESALRIRWIKYWSFSFSISPSNEYSGLISFRMDWLDRLVFQGHPYFWVDVS